MLTRIGCSTLAGVSLMKELDHPNIVKCYDILETHRHVIFAMDLAEWDLFTLYISPTSQTMGVERECTRHVRCLPPEAAASLSPFFWLTVQSLCCPHQCDHIHTHTSSPSLCTTIIVSFCAAQLRGILAAVQYLHMQEIVHRDIKLENVLLAPDGRCLLVSTEGLVSVLARPLAAITMQASTMHATAVVNIGPRCSLQADFGFARHEHADPLTTMCGTLEYAAPEILSEQVRSGGKLDWQIGLAVFCGGALTVAAAGQIYSNACDIWSLGVMAYLMLCGMRPFWDDNDTKLAKMIMDPGTKHSYDIEEWQVPPAHACSMGPHALPFSDAASSVIADRLRGAAGDSENPRLAGLRGRVSGEEPSEAVIGVRALAARLAEDCRGRRHVRRKRVTGGGVSRLCLTSPFAACPSSAPCPPHHRPPLAAAAQTVTQLCA